ncbi:unnamed protein product [Rotaria sp. Silwood1]|nr:unnamed protein product [Rotaria sp. Silwood1]CAF1685494.1 unnamed protein product [Rotaria sp. Silwood1]CAF3932733.1 unnamed protein product [Rotaria sp. Silwood1]CAF4053044.1 unnamed protein product [Rotaria sp. Silwood1]CAF5023444.1 unnamed protein product [Rotaria sp. Silwood1]
MTDNNVINRIQSARILLRKYGGRLRSKRFLWHQVVNSDYSGKIGLTIVYNMKNNVVYGTSRDTIPRELLELPVDKFTKGLIMWGAISSRALIPKDGPIFIDEFLDEYQWDRNKKRTLNGQRYIDLLQERIIPSIEQIYPNNDYIYQDDCDSIHHSKDVLEFIEKNISDRIMPMESVWSIIRTKLMKKDYQDLSHVKTEIMKIWKNFDISLCFRMMSSIPKRLQAVIKQDGR